MKISEVFLNLTFVEPDVRIYENLFNSNIVKNNNFIVILVLTLSIYINHPG